MAGIPPVVCLGRHHPSDIEGLLRELSISSDCNIEREPKQEEVTKNHENKKNEHDETAPSVLLNRAEALYSSDEESSDSLPRLICRHEDTSSEDDSSLPRLLSRREAYASSSSCDSSVSANSSSSHGGNIVTNQ